MNEPPPLPNSASPPPLPTPPPLSKQAPSSASPAPAPTASRDSTKAPIKRTAWVRTKKASPAVRIFTGLVVLAGVGFVASAIFFGSGKTGITQIRYVDSNTDTAGRIVTTTFAIDYEVSASGNSGTSCDFTFYGAAGEELETFGLTGARFAGGGTERVRVKQDDGSYRTETRSKSVQHTAQTTVDVKGIPRKVKLDC